MPLVTPCLAYAPKEIKTPLAIELYAGSFGWGAGLVAEGWRVIGVDIEHCAHHGRVPAGCSLILQDVRTLHGAQFKDAELIVSSSPCQEFSYRAMPWKRAKALGPPVLGIDLFYQAIRIQHEASEAAGRYIPLVMENVKGAQPWIGRAQWHFGPQYLWGDIPALMPLGATPKSAQDGLGGYGGSFGWNNTPMRRGNSKGAGRRAATAKAAKIPFRLAQHIARVFKP